MKIMIPEIVNIGITKILIKMAIWKSHQTGKTYTEGMTFEYQWGSGSSDTSMAIVVAVWSDGITIEYEVNGRIKRDHL